MKLKKALRTVNKKAINYHRLKNQVVKRNGMKLFKHFKQIRNLSLQKNRNH